MPRHETTISGPTYLSIRGALARWAFICVTLTLCLLAIDFFIMGPVGTWFMDVTVNGPVHRRYGFTSEWQDIGLGSRLVVTSVNANGRFARAGIKEGFAFWPATCGNFYMAGGHLWSLSHDPEAIRMETVAGDPATTRTFALRTPAS